MNKPSGLQLAELFIFRWSKNNSSKIYELHKFRGLKKSYFELETYLKCFKVIQEDIRVHYTF